MLIETCVQQPFSCLDLVLQDTTLCNDSDMVYEATFNNLDTIITSHEWMVLPTTTSVGYSISDSLVQNLNVNAMGASPGTLDLRYIATDANGCVDSILATIFILGVEPCNISTPFDTLCGMSSATLDASPAYIVTPDSGFVVSASNGDGRTEIHEILGVQDPTGVKVTITLPTWDDHFDDVILNGDTILPKVLEPNSWNAEGMNTITPWNANVNGLPRSIITIENNQVRYFSSLSTTATEMTEVFPTSWVTTPQDFVPGTNTLQFGIQNTAGPVSGSWFVEAEGINGYSYLWTTSDTTATIDINPSSTTTYGVTITAPNGCTSYCEKTIYINELLISVKDTALCFGDVISRGVESLQGLGSNYSDGTSGLVISDTTLANVTIDASSASTFAVERIELIVVDEFGCEARDTLSVTVGESIVNTINYSGCSGDGYGILVNGTVYNESNPVGMEIMNAVTGCDSTININLVFNAPVVVEAGMLPYGICSSVPEINLSELGASITGGTNTGFWTTMGDGTFDIGGIFNIYGTAMTYILGPQDIAAGEVILTLTSTDPPGPCEPAADAVLIQINDITCSQFPWAGN